MTNPNHTSSDLVARLRERTSYGEILLCHPPRPAPDRLCHEAADRIEALEAENERLRGALSDLIEQCWQCEKEITEAYYGVHYSGESLPLCQARAALEARHD